MPTSTTTTITIREDERGGQAVYGDQTLLMDGLGASEARDFAAFFRAADRTQGSRTGRTAARGGRSGASQARAAQEPEVAAQG